MSLTNHAVDDSAPNVITKTHQFYVYSVSDEVILNFLLELCLKDNSLYFCSVTLFDLPWMASNSTLIQFPYGGRQMLRRWLFKIRYFFTLNRYCSFPLNTYPTRILLNCIWENTLHKKNTQVNYIKLLLKAIGWWMIVFDVTGREDIFWC